MEQLIDLMKFLRNALVDFVSMCWHKKTWCMTIVYCQMLVIEMLFERGTGVANKQNYTEETLANHSGFFALVTTDNE